ncbi:MAG: radical SAM protein [Paludibacteraceae bacterium]|nr:radical SAM protein [Paludibacteraceae bacterium]
MAALWAMHVLRRRYVGVFIDTVLVCNYRCRMCYFSSEDERRKRRTGRLTEEQISCIARSVFHRTLKLQIGCGAEPTMDLAGALQLVEAGKQYGVPYISMTTNGVRLTEDDLLRLTEAGLDELTISLHGIRRETYNMLMGQTADYDGFLRLLQSIRHVKARFPKLNIRVNYTMNADNVDELAEFDSLFADIPINQLQLRPVREVGKSDYRNFDLSHVSECLDSVVRPLAERCRQRGITVLFPEQINIDRFAGTEQTDPRQDLVSLFAYINITPQSYPRHDIRFETETYEDYCRRTGIGRQLFRSIFATKAACKRMGTVLSNSLNYDIQ